MKFRVRDVAPDTRLDKWLADRLPELSRTRIQDLIRSGDVSSDGQRCKPRQLVVAGMEVNIRVPPPTEVALEPEAIDLDVLYEDDDIIVINKPAGMVVHPAPGHSGGTLVNALLHHCTDLGGISGELRPGIVHRLDKDTSGVLVVGKNDRAMTALQAQFKARTVQKQYVALVQGRPEPPAGRIETLIDRDPNARKKMSAKVATGRHAITIYETRETFATASLVDVEIKTGRTHQIRVHMAYIGCPVVGDTTYGGRRSDPELPAARQMLHARRMRLRHPRLEHECVFDAPPPADMADLLERLRGDAEGGRQ